MRDALACTPALPLLNCLAAITSRAVTASTFAVAKVIRPRFASDEVHARPRLVRSSTSPATRDQTASAGFFWANMPMPEAISRNPYKRITLLRFSGTPEILAMNLGASSSVIPSPRLNQPKPFARRFRWSWEVRDGFPRCNLFRLKAKCLDCSVVDEMLVGFRRFVVLQPLITAPLVRSFGLGGKRNRRECAKGVCAIAKS